MKNEDLTPVFLFLLRAYKKIISPFLPPSCRFYPTCSEYSCQALEKYGVVKGFYLTAKRLVRCHPFHAGGLDPLK